MVLAVSRGLLALIAAIALVGSGVCPDAADARRKATRSEFRHIRQALKGHLSDGFYCPKPSSTFVSTRRPLWAVAQTLSNCGLGSYTALFFVSRSSRRSAHWRFRQARYERVPGGGIPCGSRRIPRDIRCGVPW